MQSKEPSLTLLPGQRYAPLTGSYVDPDAYRYKPDSPPVLRLPESMRAYREKALQRNLEKRNQPRRPFTDPNQEIMALNQDAIANRKSAISRERSLRKAMVENRETAMRREMAIRKELKIQGAFRKAQPRRPQGAPFG